MRMKKKLSFLLLFSILTTIAFAQSMRTVKGVVRDKGDQSPMVGVNVLVKGTTHGTSTDVDGNYQIEVGNNAVLVFSFVGMGKQEIPVKNQSEINVLMTPDQELEEVVVIGYGTIKKSDLTGAVSSISAKDLQADVQKDVASAMQGRIAGVSVTSSSGQPGGSMNINVRGLSSLGNNTPLYVIDGVYGDINTVDPADIASLEVLKDASAAAIYGSRAANGVVLITTKGGKKSTPLTVNVNVFGGLQTAPKKLDLLNGEQWVGLLNGAGVDIPMKSFEGPGTNWQDEAFRTAPMVKANLSLNGGTDNATYLVSTGVLSQDGIIRSTDYSSFNLRAKTDFTLFNDHLRIGETLIFKNSRMRNYEGGVTNILRMPSVLPVYDENRIGGFSAPETWMKNMANPVGELMVNNNTDHVTEVLLNAFAELDLYKGLKYKLNVGYNKNNGRTYNKIGVYDFGVAGKNDAADLDERAFFSDSWLVENTLHYDQTFKKNTISAFVGYTAQKASYRTFGASRLDLPEGTDVISAGSSSTQKATGSANENSLVSMLGRVNYSYDSRYMISASIRRDGSSRFAKGHRYGWFPSASVGWNMQNEKFFAPLTKVVDQLKLRASYGKLGNQDVGNYLTQSIVSYGMHYVQGGSPAWWLGQIPGANWASPKDLTWEETGTFNFGFDLSMWDNRFSMSLDAYKQETKNVLLSISMPPSTGMGGSPTMNAGTIVNKGVELAFNHRNTVNEVNYNIGLNLTTIKNKVKDVTVGNKQEFSGFSPWGEGVISWAKVGDPIGSFYLLKTDGIFQSQEEVLAHSKDGVLIQKQAEPGDIRYVDYNGDGKITVDGDAQYAGSPFPDLTMGLRAGLDWRGIDFTMFFDGTFGNKIYNHTRARSEQMKEVQNFSTTVLDYWTPTNTNTDMPRFIPTDPNNNAERVSDRWLEDGSFFRLKTLELGYTLPENAVSKLRLSRLRVYASFENLFTATKYKGYTPDLGQYDGVFTRGVDVGRYPIPRTYMMGIQLDF